MREGSDQIALLHGEGFCNPRGIRPTVPSRVTMGGCSGQCRSKLQSLYYLHGAMKKAREIVFFKTKFTHLSADSNSFLLQRRPDYTILQLLRGNAHPLR